jgi:hypothetical protein
LDYLKPHKNDNAKSKVLYLYTTHTYFMNMKIQWMVWKAGRVHCAPSARALPPILGLKEDNAGEGKSRKGNVSPRWDGLILVIHSNGLFCYLFHYSTPSIFKTRAVPAKVRFISWPGKFTTKTH